jgi:hypothetical protein
MMLDGRTLYFTIFILLDSVLKFFLRDTCIKETKEEKKGVTDKHAIEITSN